MADRILHDANVVVDSSGVIANSALADTAVTPGDYNNSKTALIGITVDQKGRVTNAISTATKTSSVEFAPANASGNTAAFTHATEQRIYISTSAPNSNSIGNNGDIWYQTL